MADQAFSSSSISVLDDDFDCPICQEVLQAPVRTISCNHVFCRRCFLAAVKAGAAHCPFCRGPLNRKERVVPKRDIDMENKLKRFSIACRCCGKQVKLYMMRRHYKYCKKYQEEFGIVPEHPKLQLYQDSVGNSNGTETSDSTNEESVFGSLQENRRTRPTFNCPLCQESNLERKDLLEHCNNRHLCQIVPVVCPVCASLPWGNATQITINLSAHLTARHQFDYGEFVNPQLDEETQFQAAVEESFHLNS
ncbi:E3 ubiquitin-protein ligase RNF138-like [Microcaecilia unicolor]|uniref:E3 ubiquitin-protein ligase RNF138 n=1 Tax=Microcaecilia unicolor TaxID=1415580 RepID=A0A6P7WWZ1_9AMPH|nr:E3 ubiquitin-protein ligase RNF138-like [Microcaecilia unicolor]